MAWLDSRLMAGWLASRLSWAAEYRFFITLSAAEMDNESAGPPAEPPACWLGLTLSTAANHNALGHNLGILRGGLSQRIR
jgi:glucose-6-phosphate dehydrogenase assembly protein OpcA